MKTYSSILLFLGLASGACAAGGQNIFAHGDFEQDRSKWELIEGAKIVDAPAAEKADHGLKYLRLSLHNKKSAKVQREFKLKKPFKKVLLRMDMFLAKGTQFNPDQKLPIHVGIRHGSARSAFLGHRYLQAKDLKQGEWTTIEKEITWDGILDSFKKRGQTEAVFEIELMHGKGEILVDNIEILWE